MIEINDRQEGQHLKNAGSRRRIPLHPELIKLGFIDFANKQRGDRIFHQLKADVFGTLTGNWSKRFGRYLRNVCGVTDKRMVFHSFSHTFKPCKGKGRINKRCRNCKGTGKALDREATKATGAPVIKDCERYSGNGFSRMPSSVAYLTEKT